MIRDEILVTNHASASLIENIIVWKETISPISFNTFFIPLSMSEMVNSKRRVL